MKRLTVGKLIEFLSQFDENLEVYMWTEGGMEELEENDVSYWNNEEDVARYGEEFCEGILIG